MTSEFRSMFLHTLREDPEFRAEVRREILSDELIELPEKFAHFVAYVNNFIEETTAFMEKTNAFMEQTTAFMEKTNAFMEQTTAFMEKTTAFMEKTNAFMEKTTAFMEEQVVINRDVAATLKRLQTDVGMLKGNVARRLLRDHFEDIVDDRGLDFVRILSHQDLARMMRQTDLAAELPFGERRSFYAADMVMECIDQQGKTCYIAAEASFTADERDTSRAIRNAGFLTRLTGCPAAPMIGSVTNDYQVQTMVNDGQIEWYQLDERELEAE